jgi:hypothetical protein
MSRYNIGAMQASGMTNQQISNYIKQQDAKIYGPRGGRGPKVPVTPQVMPPVNPRPIRTATGTPIKPVKGQQVGLGSVGFLPKKSGILPDLPKMSQSESQAELEKIRGGVGAGLGDTFKNQTDRPSGSLGNVLSSLKQMGTQMSGGPQKTMMKKGGEAKKYTKGGKINLNACGVSTAQKSKSSPKW